MPARARSACGFTLIQLIVWTAVVMALTLLLYPVFVNPCGCSRKALQASCLSNLKQLGLAATMYAQDWDDTFPSGNDRWVEQLQPYVKSQRVFTCPSDANRSRNQAGLLVPGSATPFPVSYGPNLLFVNPAVYGWKRRTLTTASVKEPADKYFLADCATPDGFDLDSIAYMRYPNYDPVVRQGDWSPRQYRAAGRVAWPDKMAEPLIRHHLMTNVVFADGHAKSLRHDRIPDNDGPGGKGHRALAGAMVPWRAGV